MSHNRLSSCATYNKNNSQRYISQIKAQSNNAHKAKHAKSQKSIDATISSTLSIVSRAVTDSVQKTQQYLKESEYSQMDIVAYLPDTRENRIPEMAEQADTWGDQKAEQAFNDAGRN